MCIAYIENMVKITLSENTYHGLFIYVPLNGLLAFLGESFLETRSYFLIVKGACIKSAYKRAKQVHTKY